MTQQEKLKRYAELTSQMKSLEKEKEKLKEELTEHYGFGEAYLKEDLGFCIKLAITETNTLDSKALKESHPEIWKAFSKTGVRKNFTVEQIGGING